MNQAKKCVTCGANIVEYKHGLSKGLLRAFARFVMKTRGQVGREVEFHDLGLDYNHGSNFQKLRYWALIEKIGDAESKGGLWALTEQGKIFATGAISLPRFAWSYRGDFVRYEGSKIFIGDVTGGWRYRPDYAAEAVAHE